MGKKGKRGVDAEDLDLVPIMNLVTILIPFLLMASSFVSLAVIDSTLPAIGAPPTEQTDDEEETLSLKIVITDEGYTVAGNDAVLKSDSEEGEDPGPTVPCTKPGCPSVDSYNAKELTRLLGQIKDRWADEENVVLVPEDDISYEVLVATMDASRDDPETKVDGKVRLLFPYVVIAGGMQ
jgi:hypothetical protein